MGLEVTFHSSPLYLDKKLHRNGNAENRLCSHDSIRHKKRHLTVLKQMVYYKIRLNIIQKLMVSPTGLTHIMLTEKSLQNGIQLILKQLIIIKQVLSKEVIWVHQY